MVGRQVFPLVLTAAIFILQGGDCVSLLFADKQAHDCCRKSPCSPKSLDPRCQVSLKTGVTLDQAKEKTQLSLRIDLAFLRWTAPVNLVRVDALSREGSLFAQSPPGQLGDFSLPLLV